MMTDRKHSLAFLVLVLVLKAGLAQDTLHFRGQVSAWGNVSKGNGISVWLGGRVIPQANYEISLPLQKIIDFEFSANISGSAGFSPIDSLWTDGKIKAYRAWARYSGRQFEVRAGLQKINFGSASMLRPLMWFDQMDPRDPLQLTDGVWGLLGRYYFLNNANMWLWALVGNDRRRAWEITETVRRTPEFGGRLQLPVPPGEAAFSYHFRQSAPLDYTMGLPSNTSASAAIPEHRFALDGKWDAVAGLWFEAVWMHRSGIQSFFSNQEIITTGADFTFGIGNGVHTVLEHLVFSTDQQPFAFKNTSSFTALSIAYPVGLAHHISAIFYRDWKNDAQYNFVHWRMQFSRIAMHCMVYMNPDTYRLPQQDYGNSLFAGKGLQLMIVYSY